jgi:hypothetical protein
MTAKIVKSISGNQRVRRVAGATFEATITRPISARLVAPEQDKMISGDLFRAGILGIRLTRGNLSRAFRAENQ